MFLQQASYTPSFGGLGLNEICANLRDQAGIKFDTEKTRVTDKRGADSEKQISEARLYFRDFYGQESELTLGVRLDVSQFDKLYLPVQERSLIHPYSDAQACEAKVRCVKLEELIATKMRCLLQRRHIADLFDLVYSSVIKGDEVNRGEILSTFFRITVFGSSPGVAKGLLIDLPLEALGRFWNKYIFCPIASRFSFESAVEQFLSLIGNLIPGEAIRDRSPTFFPSALRNPIMQAADGLTLLQLRYSGVVRMVEPYSMVFKVRKDGVAREYFYGYDRTGGRSSGPGLKSFLPGSVQSIEVTDQVFEPRIEVELSKAGGAEIASTFSGRPRSIHRFNRPDLRFEIECPHCLRQFKRTRNRRELNPHKDEYGNPCYGRMGYLV